MKKRGFTLVELLVVVSIMSILGLIFTNTLVQSLRGQNKVKVINQVKQNGQVVMDKLSNSLRQAEKVICTGASVAGSPLDTVIIYKNGTYSRFRFHPPNSTSCTGSTPSNGCIKQNDFALSDIPNGVLEQNLCTRTQSEGLATNVFIVTDTDTVNGVSLRFNGQNPIFKENPSPGFNNTITVNFTVSPGVKAGQAFESQVEAAGIVFTTTVQTKGGK